MPHDTRTATAVLLLRLALGAVFIAHALAKLLIFTLPGTASFFNSVGIAGWWAAPVFLVELVGGLLLAVGLFSHWAALVLVPVMAVASSVHFPNGWMFSNPNGGWEFPVFLTAVTVAYALLGTDGRFALSALLRKG